jgi:hypothetical protein
MAKMPILRWQIIAILKLHSTGMYNDELETYLNAMWNEMLVLFSWSVGSSALRPQVTIYSKHFSLQGMIVTLDWFQQSSFYIYI